MDGNGRRAGLVGAQQQAGGSRNLGLDPEQWIPSPKDSLEFAFDVFAQIRHPYRAALAAAALYELTEDGQWLDKARSQAAHFSKSPLYRKLSELDHVEEQRVLSGLTPMQRQIAIALSQGAELDALSQQFSRSTFTLEKQIEIIFAALGVQSRHALRAELRQRKML